jgi:hypothetical protein
MVKFRPTNLTGQVLGSGMQGESFRSRYVTKVAVAAWAYIVAGSWLAIATLLPGCAKVTVTPLDPSGQPTTEAEGVRYYLPKPYLLVMSLSGSAPEGKPPPKGPVVDPKTGEVIAPGGGDTNTSSKDSPGGNTNGTSAAPSATGDISYLAADAQTVAKLIYLPDYSRPMAISESPGLFGSVNMAANLQDGWLLTSLQGAGDSKTAETLMAIASLISAAGGGAGAGAAKKAQPPGGAGVEAPPPSTQLLPPGLYAFVYNPGGLLTDVCLVRAFDDQRNNVPRCPRT